jgi:P27 family predicted phage terminase small subunit
MKGRKPVPTDSHKVAGTFRADRHGRGPRPFRADAPLPPVPKAPRWLDEEARRHWKELAPACVKMGTLTPLDASAFALYCWAWSTWKSASQQLQATGTTYTTATGLKKRHPLAGVAADALRQVMSLAGEFGLTPLGRQRLRVAAPRSPEVDELDSFLDGTPADA